MNATYPEMLLDLGAVVAGVLESEGHKPEVAAKAAHAAMERARLKWGGTEQYIPQAAQVDIAPKHARVYEDWCSGITDYTALGQLHNYTRQWVGQIIHVARHARRQKVDEPGLFRMTA